ncbi:MAG: hypothetical protein J7L47_03285, partial [Candidatus Odinarchaeota archaeon]|nr:hypothetical protein [Candidatus Odinarchaeota archaeon]
MSEESTGKNNLTFGKVVSGGFWMYLDTIVVSVIGYVYWFLIGTVGGPSIIGFASATISLAAIIMTTISLGIPVGIQRFLGKAFGENNFADLKKYFVSAFFLVFVVSSIVVSALFLVKSYFSLLLNIDDIYIILAGVLVFLNGLNTTLKSLFISILKIDKIFYIDATATIARLIGGLYLVFLGFGGIGATLGFVFAG